MSFALKRLIATPIPSRVGRTVSTRLLLPRASVLLPPLQRRELQSQTPPPVRTTSDHPVFTRICTAPRIWRCDNFLSHDECERMVELARPHIAPATIESGELDSSFRDSDSCWIPRSDMSEVPVRSRRARVGPSGSGQKSWWASIDERAFIRTIEERIERVTRSPLECGEPIQVLRYSAGQQYRTHCDYYTPEYFAAYPREAANGGQRVGIRRSHVRSTHVSHLFSQSRLDWQARL